MRPSGATAASRVPAARRRIGRHIRWLVPVGVVVAALLVLGLHNVPTAATTEDLHYAALVLEQTGHSGLIDRPRHGFGDQIAAILAVQDAVLRIAPSEEGIPLDQPREPADLYRWRQGLCFDRSRSIEKLLRVLGFRDRHVSIYDIERNQGWGALFERDVPSHAVTEVLTSRGWLVVDSKRRWVSLDVAGRPVSIAALQAGGPAIAWSADLTVPIDPALGEPFTYVIGLYSRHGRFYPPYDAIPDVSWPDMFDNLPRLVGRAT